MAVAAYASGTQTAVLGTEHFVSSPGDEGTYTFHVDLSGMAAGDVVTLRVYQKVLAGGAVAVAYTEEFYGAQAEPVAISVPVSNELVEADALRFSIEQTEGVGRDFPWKVLSY